MNHHRYLICYCSERLLWRRIAPFYVWAETEELAIAYAAQWVGPPQNEVVHAYYCPTQALAAA